MCSPIKSLILAIALLTCSVASATSADSAVPSIESLRSELANAVGQTDSIRIMYDIFDLTPNESKEGIATEMFDYAVSIKNYDVASDLICWLAFINLDDADELARLHKIAKSLPYTSYTHMAQTYIALRRAGYSARYDSPEVRTEKIRKELESGYFNSVRRDYDKIEVLGSICILVGSSNAYKNLITEYINEELEIARKLPDSMPYFIKSVIYNYAVMIYTDQLMHEEAVEIARERIDFLNRIVEARRKSGRKYFNLDYILFSCYKAMLKNYEALSRDEAQLYYDKIQEIIPNNQLAATDNHLGEADAYFNMACGKYTEAIPYLWHIYENTKDQYVKQRVLRQLIVAANNIGDNDTLLRATTIYNELLQTMLDDDARDTYSEMQTIYNVDELKKENLKLELRNKEDIDIRNHLQQRILTVVLYSGCGALLLITIFVAILYRKKRKLVTSLASSNEALTLESENLRSAQQSLIEARDKATAAEEHKTKFIEDMSHEITTPLEAIVEYTQLIVDCADAEKKKYLLAYADIVKLNAELLNRIVSDILDISALENPTINVVKRPVAVNDLCDTALRCVANYEKPNVERIFKPRPKQNPIIVTDEKRVEQVLINLLTNAEKFTEQGSVTLDYTTDRDNNTITFSVTDTGPGIPKGKEEVIFERFVKLGSESQGVGLGLSVCKMTAELLNGTIHVDPDYDNGARFLFTIPMS